MEMLLIDREDYRRSRYREGSRNRNLVVIMLKNEFEMNFDKS